MRAFTNRAAGIRGDTIPVTVRLPRPVVEFIDGHLSADLANRSEWLQHSAAVMCMVVEARDAS